MLCLAIYFIVMVVVAYMTKRLQPSTQILVEGLALFGSMVIMGKMANMSLRPSPFSLSLMLMAVPFLMSEGEEYHFPHNLSFTIVAVFLLPVSEEILFRWCLLKDLGISISAILFSAAHITNVISGAEKFSVYPFFARFMVGWIMGVVTLQSGSILPAIVFHSLVNALGVFQMKKGDRMSKRYAHRI